MSDPAAPAHLDEPSAVRLALRLLTAAAAVGALVLAGLTAAAGPRPERPERPAAAPALTTPSQLPRGSLPINLLPPDELAERLPGIGPSYAARIAHVRTIFGPLRSADDLSALGIPSATVRRIAPLISFRT